MNRREFLKAIVAMGASASIFDSIVINRAIAAPQYFGLHPFIESHPEAVFIRRTNVLAKTDSESKKLEGNVLAKVIFTLRDTPGIPISDKIAVKPNLTCTGGKANTADNMGIITDPYFTEGVLESMINMGLPEDNIYIREGNWLGDSYCPAEYAVSPYKDISEKLGVHLADFPTGRKITQLDMKSMEEGLEVIWKDCADGIVFRRIGYVAPFNDPDSWLLNIAKFKTHGMGMTLCAKNAQGMCIHPHIHFCAGINSSIINDFQPNTEEHIEDLHALHLSEGIPRWDRPGRDWNSGYGMEMWAQRTCDSLSVTNTGLCMIEGIYGRNGNAFFEGPGPGGTAEDFMTNVIIFGKNPFKVDVIGHWLGGHEPGNFGLFHIAKERKLTDTFNPASIPVYLWENGTPTLTPLTELERFPLLTYYLQKNYGGLDEPKYHLVDEPYDYGVANAVDSAYDKKSETQNIRKPDAKIIGQNFPNPFNGFTVIEYQLPKDGYVTLEIYDLSGRLIDVLVKGWQSKGAHAAHWNPGDRVSGIYFYLFRSDGIEKIGKMILAR